jgi:hypothetical protein
LNSRIVLGTQEQDLTVLFKLYRKRWIGFNTTVATKSFLTVRRIAKGRQAMAMPQPGNIRRWDKYFERTLMDQGQPQVAVSTQRFWARSGECDALDVQGSKKCHVMLGQFHQIGAKPVRRERSLGHIAVSAVAVC